MGNSSNTNYQRKVYGDYTKPINNGDSGTGSLFDQEDDCANYNLAVRLQNPGPGLTSVNKGDILLVRVNLNDVVSVLNTTDEMCGSIAHPKVPKLIECIKKGNTYTATVTSIHGSVCDVLIKIA